MTTISSRNPPDAPKNGLTTVELTNSEITLMLALLHCSSLRTYGISYSYYAYTLTEKLTSSSGMTTSLAVQLVEPKINLYDDKGAYITTYHNKDFRITFK
jgi:hypothetical protein